MHQSQQEKVKTESWLLSQNNILNLLFYLLILFLPTQFGKHFWPNFSFVFGLRLDYLSPTIYLTDIIITLLFLFCLPNLKTLLEKIGRKNLLFFGLFLLSIFTGVMASKNPLAGFYGITKFLEYAFLTLFIAANFKRLNKSILFFCFLSGIVFESFLSFLQYFNQGALGGLFYFFGERAFNAQTPGIANASINGQLFLRPYATFPHPNVLAGFLIVAMLYLFLFFKNKKYLAGGILLGTISLLLTLSRTVIVLWLTYLFFLFGISLVKKYKNRFSKTKLSAGIITILVLAIFTYLFFQNSFLFQRFFLTKITDEALTQRTELIQQSMAMFFRNPVFGVGINNFFNNVTFTNSELSALLIQPAHNIFLFVLSETGLIGFCSFIYLFYKGLRGIIRKNNSKERKYFLMLFFAVIFLGSFDHYFLTIQQGQIMLAIIIGSFLSRGKL